MYSCSIIHIFQNLHAKIVNFNIFPTKNAKIKKKEKCSMLQYHSGGKLKMYVHTLDGTPNTTPIAIILAPNKHSNTINIFILNIAKFYRNFLF